MASGSKLGSNKDVEKLARAAKKNGVTVEITGGNHILWVGPSGKRYYSGLTPSDPNRLGRLKKFLRNEGVPV